MSMKNPMTLAGIEPATFGFIIIVICLVQLSFHMVTVVGGLSQTKIGKRQHKRRNITQSSTKHRIHKTHSKKKNTKEI